MADDETLDASVLATMTPDARVEALIAWFRKHYKDPATSISNNSREGGYPHV
jgi:hypothetical protein